MKTILTLILSCLITGIYAQKDSTSSIEFNGISAYGVIGLIRTNTTPSVSSRGVFFEYDRAKNGKSLGLGLGVQDLWENIDKDQTPDSLRMVTCYPLYTSLKLFTDNSLFFHADLGLVIPGDMLTETGRSSVFSIGMGVYPNSRKIPFTIRARYQRVILSRGALSLSHDSFYIGVGLYIR